MDLIQLWFYEKVRTTAFVKYRVPYSPKLTLKNGLKLDNFADFLQHNEYLSRSMNEVGEIELHCKVVLNSMVYENKSFSHSVECKIRENTVKRICISVKWHVLDEE